MADIQDNARMAVLRDQEERVVAYNDFEEGYRKYLNGGDETDYTRLCTEVTARFQAASHDVNNCEEQLKGVGAVQLCGWIRKLQEAEKQKLHLTIALQVERKRARQMQEQRDNRAKGLSKEEADSIQEEEDFVSDIQDDKLKWMNTQIDEAVVQINEALDEIRYWEG